MGVSSCIIGSLELPVTLVEATSISDGVTCAGIIREYISPIGGNNTLVVIDCEPSGMNVISINPSQIISIIRNFPVGSKVVFYYSHRDNQYAFRKPGAPYPKKKEDISTH
jgi:hypothetical protein